MNNSIPLSKELEFNYFKIYELYRIMKPYPDPYEQTHDLLHDLAEIDNENAIHTTTCKILLYKKRIKEIKDQQKITKEEIEEIRQQFIAAHDDNLTEESNVTHLYTSGRITNQKGGDLYLARSEFTSEEEIIFPDFDLDFTIYKQLKSFNPIQSTYIVTTRELAKEIRDRMLKLSKRDILIS